MLLIPKLLGGPACTVCAQAVLFSDKRSQNNARTTHFMLGGRFPKGWEDGLCTTLADFFHQIKVHQPLGRKISI